MNKLKYLAVSIILGLAGCSSSGGDDCETNIAGCASDDYSCPQAAFCYTTKDGCRSGGECD
ncbi:MAG: hypothetical protein AAF353_08875 [Pseudomonadota bacterium]